MIHIGVGRSSTPTYADHGAVAELADAGDLKSSGGNTLWVRFPPALLPREQPRAIRETDGAGLFTFVNLLPAINLARKNVKHP